MQYSPYCVIRTGCLTAWQNDTATIVFRVATQGSAAKVCLLKNYTTIQKLKSYVAEFFYRSLLVFQKKKKRFRKSPIFQLCVMSQRHMSCFAWARSDWSHCIMQVTAASCEMHKLDWPSNAEL